MRVWIAAALALALTPALSATLYKWVDENGTIHFSDQPHPGAEAIEVEGAQTFDAPPVPAPRAAVENEAAGSEAAYESLVIVSPRQGQTLWNTGGTVSVAISIVPRLRPGHEVQVFYDGNAVEREPQASLTFNLPEVFRGTHTLRATVVDNAGTVLGESETVTFYVHQTSIIKPGNQGN
ncbi:MAG: DUF4124 domain-containing protein [Gammaproteobacteria bacterium]